MVPSPGPASARVVLPLLIMVMRVASMIPIFSDIAVRMHFINALASAFVVTLLYLITVRMILLRHALPESDI